MQRFLILMSALILFLVAGYVLANRYDTPRVLVSEVQQKLLDGEDLLFLDTRSDLSRARVKVKIPDAVLMKSADTLNRLIRETPKDKLIVTYCT